MSSVYRPFVEKLGGADSATFVGNEGEIFWDPTSNTLRRSDGSTPGGAAQPADKLISLSQLHNILNASSTFGEFKTALLEIDPTTP